MADSEVKEDKDNTTEDTGERCCQDQIQCRMFWLTNEDPHRLVTSKWPCLPPWGFLVYRIFIGLSTTTLTIMNGWAEGMRYHNAWIWFSWATNWGIVALSFVLWIFAIYTIVYTTCSSKLIKDERMPICLAIAWAVYNAAAASAFVITGCYWVYLLGMDPSPIFKIPESYAKHSLNSMIIIIDLFVSDIPIRFLHFIFPVMFAIIYCIFNYLWHVLNGPLIENQKSIYKVINWHNPGVALLFIFINVSMLLVAQAVLYFIYKLRMYLQKTVCVRASEYQELET